MQLITLKKLTLHNFMGYKGDNSLDFEGKDIVGILAEYDGDKERSNRAGKCFGKGTPIMMYDGCIKAVELISNGELVMGPDSKPRKVQGVTSGKEEMFRIESHDGSIGFTCNASHVLALKSSKRTTIKGQLYNKEDIITLTVSEFVQLPDWKKKILNLFRSNEIDFNTQKNILDPYVLGVWLGDGACDANRITIADKEIFDYLKVFSDREGTNFKNRAYKTKSGYDYWDVSLTGKVTGFQSKSSTSLVSRELKNLNLFGNKHIPQSYLKTSIKERLELLAGIIDTDGHLSKGRLYEVVCKYEKLKDGIVHLCRSLGLAVSVTVKEGAIKGVSKGNYFRINIYGDISKIPCKVVRKKSNFKTTKRDVLRKGFTVCSLGDGDYYGFTVDKDHLFLLGDFTVVHNTSIMEAVGYCLTGVSRTKSDEKLIHKGEKEMWVECTFTDGSKDYVIKRGRDHKNKGILELNWIQKVSDVKEEIEKVFGISPEDFYLTSFFRQADTAGFMHKKPSEKAEFLMQWLDNKHWQEKEKLANEDRKVVKQKLRDNENLKKALETSLEIDESLSSMQNDLKVEVEDLNKQKEELNEKLGAVNSDISSNKSKKDEVQGQINTAKKKVRELGEKLDESEDDKEKLNSLRKEYANTKKELEAIEKIEESDIAEFKDKLDKLKHKRAQAKNAITTSEEYSTGLCPVLKASCDRLVKDPSEIEKYKRDIKSFDEEISSIVKSLNDTENATKLASKLDLIKERANRVKERLSSTEGIPQEIEDLKSSIQDLTTRLESLDLTELLDKKSEVQDSIKEINEEIKQRNDKIVDYEVRISAAKEAKGKIDRVVAENEKLQHQLSMLNYTCFMFSKNGIPALEIENSFQEIEDNINWILKEILPNVQISFSPDKELKSLEPVCLCGFQFPKGFRGGTCPECSSPRQNKRKEEIAFSVIEDGEERDFDMDSGGGKSVISYAVRIALTMLKRSQRKCNLNMLFLDEIDSALDPYLARQIIGTVTNFLTKKLGYEQVLLVSHKEEIKNALPHTIKVTRKISGSSVARFI
jgi:DNA repair exonuclease SbcCD ATPase subunit